MDLLVIGGTRFSGRALTEAALAAGHRVTLFHRGTSGADRFPGAEHVLGDRSSLGLLGGRRFDAVVDLCGFVPRVVGASARALADSGSYVFVSSISACAPPVLPGATEDTPSYAPPFPDTEVVDESTYGPLKVACERAVLEVFGERAAIVRPGYIVGPHDPSDRFPSLVRRAARGGEMLVPGPPDEPLQFVDARDLGAFLLLLAEKRRGGTFHAIHPWCTTTIGEVVALAGPKTRFVWADPHWLAENLGPDRDRAFPMWDPDPGGFHQLDGSKAAAAGLATRPVAETVRDTLAWDLTVDRSSRPSCGLPIDREWALLDAWRDRQAAR